MRLDNFDLNLLIALNILLEEQSVSRAAARLNLTQSAVSAALNRLRAALNDQLLVAHGRKMLLTPHARALAPQVASTIQHLRALVSGATVFDPATSDRCFEIAASDYITMVLVAPLITRLKREAPHVQFNLVLPQAGTIADLQDGKVDCFLSPEEFLCPDQPRELLFEEEHVVVGWSENPVFAAPLTEAAFLSCGHVAVHINGGPSFIERHLDAIMDRRRVEVIAPYFSLAPWLLPNTHHLALMHRRLADIFVGLLPLTVAPAPFAVPRMREMVQYHSARSDDQAIRWLLDRLHQAAATHTAGAGAMARPIA